jgi:hypothetical protein
MTCAVSIDVHVPGAVYQALHAQLLERTGGQAGGLLAHLARPNAEGFQVLEVWDTKPAMATSTTPSSHPSPPRPPSPHPPGPIPTVQPPSRRF